VIVSGKMEISAFVMGPVGSLPGCVYVCVCVHVVGEGWWMEYAESGIRIQ